MWCEHGAEQQVKDFRIVLLWEKDILQDPDSIRRQLTTLLTEKGEDAAEA